MRLPLTALVTLLLAACASGDRAPIAADRRDVEPRQYLFRLAVARGDEAADLRLVLRTAGAARYELRAADLVGRAVWSLGVAGQRFVWTDFRERRFCRGSASNGVRLPLLRFEMPLAAVPNLLLEGRPFAGSGGAGRGSGTVTTLDASGRSLASTLADGRLVAWTLHDASGHRLADWERDGGGSRLVVPGGNLDLRWRLVSGERGAPLGALAAPEEFRETACDDVDFS